MIMNQLKKVTIVETTDSKCQLKNGDRIAIAELKNIDRAAQLAREAKYRKSATER